MVKFLERKFAMNLQFFAEPEETGGSVDSNSNDATVGETNDESTEQKQEGKDLNSVIEKLQKRLNSKTQAEKETKDQLAHALERIEQLEKKQKGSKAREIKEGTEDAKANSEQTLLDERDKEIADLKRQLKYANSIAEGVPGLKKEIIELKRELGQKSEEINNIKSVILSSEELRNSYNAQVEKFIGQELQKEKMRRYKERGLER